MSPVLRFATQKAMSPHNKLLVDLADPRCLIDRFKDVIVSAKKEQASRELRKYNPLILKAQDLFPKLKETTKAYDISKLSFLKEPSSKLVVLIHGLNSSPLAWSGYLDKLSTQTPTTSCFAPYVYKKGYCKVAEAAIPILNVVQAYADQYPNNCICLVGHSNGARIAAYIERELQAKNIRLVSIAGAHCGSKLMRWISILGMEKTFRLTPEMTEELSYLGDWPTQELIKWQTMQENTEKKVDRLFFATASDSRIFPIETSFPNLPNSSYVLVGEESHVTIIDGVKETVLSYLLEPNSELLYSSYFKQSFPS